MGNGVLLMLNCSTVLLSFLFPHLVTETDNCHSAAHETKWQEQNDESTLQRTSRHYTTIIPIFNEIIICFSPSVTYAHV